MNYKLICSYDGTRYRGWQRQGNTADTIQARLESALKNISGQAIRVDGSGRTDAGVHARAQVASFQADTPLSPDELLRRLRAVLPEDIGALSLLEADPRFHARLSARGKTYVYRLWRTDEPNVFERHFITPFLGTLDQAAMRQAANLLLGTHDFRSFCGNPRTKKSTVRTLTAIELQDLGRELRLWFSGNGFLYHMVRLLVGTLLAVGSGTLCADEVPLLLAGAQALPPMCPAKGLTLWQVYYEGDSYETTALASTADCPACGSLPDSWLLYPGNQLSGSVQR